MKNMPYIGVTDITTKEQVDTLKKFIPPWVDRRLHVGAMISHKTFNGYPTSTGWENIWLNEQGMNELFVKDSMVYNVVHYANYPNDNGVVEIFDHELSNVYRRAGPGVEAIQLDMIWPNAKHIYQLKDEFPNAEVILQVSSKAIEYTTKHNLSVRDALECYSTDLINYVLLDFGMGKGIAFDPSTILELIEQIIDVYPERKIAVAGGLGPDTYYNLKPIFAKYPNISCDAQGQLRASGSAVDPLDMNRAEQYIKNVCTLL